MANHPPLLRMRNLLRTFNHFSHPWEAFPRHSEPTRAAPWGESPGGDPVAARRRHDFRPSATRAGPRDGLVRKGPVLHAAPADFASVDFENQLVSNISPDAASPSLGESLRQAREASGRGLGEVTAVLRIREDYLRAIEAGDYAELPAPAYAIGFIRSYAAHLRLDGNELVRRFKRETESQHFAHDLDMPKPASEPKMPRGLLIGLAILALCGYGIWHYRSSEDQGRAERVATVPPALLALPNEPAPPPVAASATGASQVKVLSGLSPAAGHAPASGAGALEAKVPLTPTRALATVRPARSSEPVHIYGASGDVPYRITLRATAETWLEVKDGKISIFRGLMQAGDEYRMPEKPGLVMRLGNVRSIEVLVDGKPLPNSAQPSRGRRAVVDLGATKLLAYAGTQ